MRTAYIGPLTGELNDQTASRTVELRVEDSEAFPGQLAISVNSHKSGKEFVLAHLSLEQAIELAHAIDTWRTEKGF